MGELKKHQPSMTIEEQIKSSCKNIWSGLYISRKLVGEYLLCEKHLCSLWKIIQCETVENANVIQGVQ